MLHSEKENTSPVPQIQPAEEQDFIADAKRRLTLDGPTKITRRKSVENLVISSHDAIGQSISHALSFSGAITQQGTVPEHSRSSSRSPSPCRRTPAPTTILEHGDYPGQISDSGSVQNSARQTNDNLSISPPPSLSVSAPTPEQASPIPLNRSSSQECHPRNSHNLSNKKEESSRSKKKSWYSSLYPTYKSRSEDFKRIFKDVPDDERLIVDYSCAIQKDILVHGRLYVSQNYLCFYANIFRWETSLSLRWKDVTAITKEKTALVIPNAILVCTESEKHFLTSFAGRDKTYLMLFRIWQNALMEQPMSSQEMWQWVHICYGEELGFNSDDEDYPQNFLEEEKLSGMRLSAESITEDFLEHAIEGVNASDIMSGSLETSGNTRRTASAVMVAGSPGGDINSPPPLLPSQWRRCTPHASNNGNIDGDLLPTDMSDSSQSDIDKPISFGIDHGAKCNDPHEGKKLLCLDLNIHIDQLFTMLFTNSKFYVELLASRKATDLVQGSWNHDAGTGLKTRIVSFTLPLNQTVGPKTAAVTETQVMLPCTKPGQQYSIEITSGNAGIPYADSFVVMVHYCLHKISENVTNFQVYGHIKYKKSVWAVIKTFIEKNSVAGLEEYFDCLSKALSVELDDDRGISKRKSRRRRKGAQRDTVVESELLPGISGRPLIRHRSPGGRVVRIQSNSGGPSPRLLWTIVAAITILVVINATLYYRLWGFSFFPIDNKSSKIMGPDSPSPELIAEWSQLLKEQSSFHLGELDRWRKALNDAITLLKQTETALANLQSIIKPSVEKTTSTLPNSEL